MGRWQGTLNSEGSEGGANKGGMMGADLGAVIK